MQEQLNINEAWVIDSFRECVRLNVRGGIELTKRLAAEQINHVMDTIQFSPDFLDQLRFPQITYVSNNNLAVPEQIYNIATNSRFRRGNYNLISEFENKFIEKIAQRVNSQSPIRITVPTLPFKDQNPLSTQREIAAVDLGELLFFRQMGDLCESVNKVYEPGMYIDLVSDGSLYQEIFLDNDLQTGEQVAAYYANSQLAIDSLGLNNVLKLHNLESMIEGNNKFVQNRETVIHLLRNLDSRGILKTQMDELSLGMVFNSASFMQAEQRDPIDFAYGFQTQWQKDPQAILEQFKPNALAYSSFLIAMKSLDILGNYFPDNIRGTVHPKNAPQLPLHTVNKNSLVAPYNGVPVISRRKLEKTNDLRSSTRIMRYGELILTSQNIAKVAISNDSSFAYMIDSHG
jgi:pyoverdine/dityrosine biosynthesis protein Dit1